MDTGRGGRGVSVAVGNGFAPSGVDVGDATSCIVVKALDACPIVALKQRVRGTERGDEAYLLGYPEGVVYIR